MRVRTLAAVLGVAVLAGPWWGLRSADAARVKVTVKKKALNPRKLGGGGGDVWVVLQVKHKKTSVGAVAVRTTLPGGGGAYSYLSAVGKNRFQGYCQIPRNSQPRKLEANLVAVVTTPDGMFERRIGSVKVGPGSDSLPPPPPPN
jgi:hypothetical protein